MGDSRDETALREVGRRMVPRYTSYPTAPHFRADLEAAAYREWLAMAAATGTPASIYLHVPFCRSMCHYCGCNTKAVRREEPVRAYADTLAREIDLVGDVAGRIPISHLHWGGGTPNLLPPDCMELLVERLAARFAFLPGMAHAIELDPRHVTFEGALTLARLGVNRASLGIQDMDDDVQRAIGRVQPIAQVRRSVEALRDAGIDALNFDVMYGLPYQTVDTIRATAAEVARLRPSRIALFGYAHVPWMKPHQKLIDEALLPGVEARLGLARAAREVFRHEGYLEIGIDHFALPGDALCEAMRAGGLRRNFQGYTTDAAELLVGLGASSIGRTPFGLVQNATDVAGWRREVEAGRLPIARGVAFRDDDLPRAAVIERLLCDFEVDLAAIAAAHGADPACFGEDLASLAEFVDRGWVTVCGSRVAVVRHKAEIARVVASCFDAYLERAGRHSVAV